jgi:hypothetical protein
MATAEIVSGERPYYTVRVVIGDGRTFDQVIYLDKDAGSIAADLQAYADDYAAGLPPVEPDSAAEARS